MIPQRTCGILIVLIGVGLHYAHAQQAVSPVGQARLQHDLPEPKSTNVDANGVALSEDDTTEDDTFGEALVLKNEPRIRTFLLTGDASVYYTNNAALTRRKRIDDAFFVGNAALSWTPVIAPRLAAQVAAHTSIFRYDSTPALDFESLEFGTGLFWSPDHFGGIGLFVHYDFIELLDSRSSELLRDHEFTIGAQKIFPLGRAQAFAIGTTLTAGLAEPESAQRDQAGLFLGYRIQATRSLGIEFQYRFSGYFYNDPGHIDRTQLWSTGVSYRLGEWTDINAYFSFVDNQSDEAAFEYDAVTSGGGLSLTHQF